MNTRFIKIKQEILHLKPVSVGWADALSHLDKGYFRKDPTRFSNIFTHVPVHLSLNPFHPNIYFHCLSNENNIMTCGNDVEYFLFKETK